MASPCVTYRYQFEVGGVAASGYWAKAYQPGTTVAVTIYTDAAAGTGLTKAQVNSEGRLATTAGAIFTPHFTETHDIWLFTSEALADADDTSVATKVASEGVLVSEDTNKAHATVAAMVADANLTTSNTVTTYDGNRLENWQIAVSGVVAEGDVLLDNALYAKRTEERHYMMPNGLFNGDMELARNTGDNSLPTTIAILNVDAWAVFQNNTSAGTAAQSTVVPAGFKNSYRLGRDNASTSNDAIGLQQALQTVDSLQYAGRSVTLSVYLQAGANYSGGNINVSLFTGTGTDQNVNIMSTWTGSASPISTTQAITTTATRYTFKGLVAASSTQVGVRFFYTPTGTAGADDNFYITGVKLQTVDLEASHTRRPFEAEVNMLRHMVPPCGRLSNLGASNPFSQAHLVPFNGNTILINGKIEIIPFGLLSASGGVIATYSSTYLDGTAAQALAINTKYYVYAFMNSGVMTLDFSETVWADDPFYGHRVKSGDVTRTLVGFLRTDGSTNTLGTANQQTMVSFHNRIRYAIFTNVSGSTTSNTAVEIDSADRVEIVQWSDDLAIIHAYANVSNSVANNRCNIGIGLNSTTVVAGAVSITEVTSTLAPSQSLYTHALNPGEDQYFLISLLGFETEDVSPGTLTVSSGQMFADSATA